MRKAAALIVINLASVLLANGANRTDRDVHGLKGAVGCVRVETAKLSISAGKVVEGPRSRTEKRVYNDKGSLAWETLYNGDSIVASRHFSNERDGSQSETAHTRRPSAETGSVAPRGMTTSQFVWSHKSDVAGNRIESSGIGADGSVACRLVYSYDAAGKLTSATQYGTGGAPIQRWLYDSAGDIKERNGLDEHGSVTDRDLYSYEYDAEKNWTKRITSRQLNGPKSAGEPVEATYRTIAYYPPVGDFQMNGGVIPGVLTKSASGESILSSGGATKRVEPVYPLIARAAHVSGIVVVEATVDEEGDVLSARATSGHPLLRGAALDAAWDWKFSPIVIAGKAVKVIGTIEFNFHL